MSSQLVWESRVLPLTRSKLAPTVKALMDGLIDAGLLPDDSDRFLDGPRTIIADRLAVKRLGVRMYEDPWARQASQPVANYAAWEPPF